MFPEKLGYYSKFLHFMTVRKRYNVLMNLLSVQGTGAALTIALFLFSLFIVHAIKLAKIGWRTLFKKLPPQEPKKPEPKPEPVYFIVERKKKKAKTDYSEPKRIQFK